MKSGYRYRLNDDTAASERQGEKARRAAIILHLESNSLLVKTARL